MLPPCRKEAGLIEPIEGKVELKPVKVDPPKIVVPAVRVGHHGTPAAQVVAEAVAEGSEASPETSAETR